MATARWILLVLYSTAAIVPFASGVCNRACGGEKNSVPYPFGFSEECPIRLTCFGHENYTFDGFKVRNVTSRSFSVDLPPSCRRPISTVASFFGASFAMTARNTLLLQNCSSNYTATVCLSSLSSFSSRLGEEAARCKSDPVSCFSAYTRLWDDNRLLPFLTRDLIDRIDCSDLFSSSTFISEDASIELRTVELGWWLKGNCSSNPCHPNANCSYGQATFLRPHNRTSFENIFFCDCREGFDGDGFLQGSGCRRESMTPAFWNKKATRAGILVGVLLTGAVFMAMLGVLYCCIRRRSISSRMRHSARRLLSEARCAVHLYPLKEIEKATNSFSEENKLGTGAYGTVYVGKLASNELVAVKKIRHRDAEATEQVMNEIKLLSSVSHPNLVRILGCCIEKGEKILVYEFMPNGTLAQQLQRESHRPGLPWPVRLAIAADTAKAIAHLHTAIHPPIYHRDIKSSNILLDYNFNSKVADFGLSKMIVSDMSHVSTGPQGTPGYLDPQYHQNFHLSDKSDVYSFGVVLVEMITAMKAVDFSRAQSEVNLAALAVDKIGGGRVVDIIDPFLEPHRDPWTLSSIHEVAELAFRCLAFHRDMRPSMKEVADELEHIRQGKWVGADESVFLSPASSMRSEKSKGATSKSSRLGGTGDRNTIKLTSPVSVQEPWFSDQSSPSADSLLGNAAP
ncbi:protein kinase superfamily protein [Wolffia australiana]